MRKDLVYALRNMARNPGVFTVAILALALGIGANTAMFSVIYAVLLRPLPYPEPDRLVTIYAGIRHLNISGAFVEYNTFVDWWRPHNRSFDSMAAYSPGSAILIAGGQPQRIHTLRVSASYLSLLGARPALGRDFRPEEDQAGARRVAILGDGIWKRRFSARRDVLGRSILLDKKDYTVIGVLPTDFDLDPADVYLPIAHSGARVNGMPSVGAYARLKHGVSLQAAQADIDSLNRGWIRRYHYPDDWGAAVWNLRAHMVRSARPSIMVLAAAVALVLLMACANVANLLLARAAARRREISIRGAIGATRNRIVRQLLTESAALSMISATVGVALAWAATRAIAAADVPVPFSKQVSINASVLGFTMVAAVLTAVLFGLAPALSAVQPGPAAYLNEGGRGGFSVGQTRFRAAMIVMEIAFSLVLLIGAALTMRSLARLLAVNPGFNPESVLTADLMLPEEGYADAPRRANFFQALIERVGAMPGVTSVGIVSDLPFGGSKSGNDIVVEGAPPQAPNERLIAFVRTVDPGYFPTIQVRLLRGRFFTPRDSAGPLVAIVNESLARRCWPNQDPVGKRFAPGSQSGRPPLWFTVTGVIGDMLNSSLTDAPDLEYFIPYAKYPQPNMSVAVRTGLDPLRLASALRAAVGEIDKGLPVSDVARLADSISHSTRQQRFATTLLGIFALLALLLAAVGIYGVVSYTVTRRTHEIGVRIALGAAPGRVMVLIVGQALVLGAAGITIGIGGSLALTRLLRSLLYGVSATDPAVFVAASLFLLTVSVFAAFLPARRAATTDPAVALHQE